MGIRVGVYGLPFRKVDERPSTVARMFRVREDLNGLVKLRKDIDRRLVFGPNTEDVFSLLSEGEESCVIRGDNINIENLNTFLSNPKNISLLEASEFPLRMAERFTRDNIYQSIVGRLGDGEIFVSKYGEYHEILKAVISALFKGDVDMWNRWKRNYTGIIDLSGLDLSRAGLNYANLTRTFLFDTNFTLANLTKADLTDAIAVRAKFILPDLTNANLSRAFLHDAYFISAVITDARFINANLTRAFLYNLNVTKTNFTNAIINGTIFIGVDISKAKGFTQQMMDNASLYSTFAHLP